MSQRLLSKLDIERGLRRLDTLAQEAGVFVDIAIYGGAALALAFNARPATRDVDAVFRQETLFIRDAARTIAAEEGWPEDWLNDGVKRFVSDRESLQYWFEPSHPAGGLRVYTPVPEYLFAMKCLAMRLEGLGPSRDRQDIEWLARHLGINHPTQAFALIEQFYPNHRIPLKVQFGLEEILERLSTAAQDDAPHYPGGLESLKAILLAQSPAAFRRRLIFVEADPLFRPRRETPPITGNTAGRR